MSRTGRRVSPVASEPLEFRVLLLRAKSGDRAAATALLARHAGHLNGIAHRALSPALRRLYDTVDVAQSVARELLHRLPRLEDRGESAFRRWIGTVARVKAGEKARKLRRGGIHAEREAGDRVEVEPSRAESPDQAAERRELSERLAHGLGHLDQSSREVVLRRARGDEFATIACELELPSAEAARKRYARALVVLRHALAR